jgi:hypothetical protein
VAVAGSEQRLKKEVKNRDEWSRTQWNADAMMISRKDKTRSNGMVMLQMMGSDSVRSEKEEDQGMRAMGW